MKFLIAGYGSIGRRHLRNLLALGEKDITIFRTRQSTLPEDELEGLRIETDLQIALAERPDGVIIANPTARHLDIAIPAAEQGCHIMIEKPISHSFEGVDVFKRAVIKSGSRVLVAHQFRFHPGLRKVKAVLSSGEIGRPISMQAHLGEYLPSWHPWEDYRKSYSARADLGGGVALTQCHPLDYTGWLLGDGEVVWSQAIQTSDLEMEVDDLAEFALKFPGGVSGFIHLNCLQQPTEHTLEIICSGGTVRWDNADGTVRVYHPKDNAWTDTLVPDGFERNVMFMDEMRHFIGVVKGEEEPTCTLDDGIRVLKIALTAKKAIH